MEGKWRRKPKKSATVVFVHGFLSDDESCWQNENGSSWPDLFEKENSLQNLGIYVLKYDSNFISNNFYIEDICAALKDTLEMDRVIENEHIIFICHSMGGIVIRKYLVSNFVNLHNKLLGLFLVASPTSGSSFANWFDPIIKLFNHKQAVMLKKDNPWLIALNKEFSILLKNNITKINGRELFEETFILKFLYFVNPVVMDTGQNFFPYPLKIPSTNHFTITKPRSSKAFQHRILTKFVKETIDKSLLIESPDDDSKETHNELDESDIVYIIIDKQGNTIVGPKNIFATLNDENLETIIEFYTKSINNNFRSKYRKYAFSYNNNKYFINFSTYWLLDRFYISNEDGKSLTRNKNFINILSFSKKYPSKPVKIKIDGIKTAIQIEVEFYHSTGLIKHFKVLFNNLLIHEEYE